MTTNQFVANFRVSKNVFVMLMVKWSQAFRSSKIRPNVKLTICSRFLATGSYQRTVGNENVSSTAKSSVNSMPAWRMPAVFEDYIYPQWIKMSVSEEEREIMKTFFYRTGFPGVIECMDGTHIRIKSPGDNDKRLYYTTKGFCSINAMTICDHKMTIIFVDARHPGSDHDAFIWEHSAANQRLQSDFVGGRSNAWIRGDRGYKLSPFLITLFRNPNSAERCFNNKHTSTRNVVERCFGMLKTDFVASLALEDSTTAQRKQHKL